MRSARVAVTIVVAVVLATACSNDSHTAEPAGVDADTGSAFEIVASGGAPAAMQVCQTLTDSAVETFRSILRTPNEFAVKTYATTDPTEPFEVKAFAESGEYASRGEEVVGFSCSWNLEPGLETHSNADDRAVEELAAVGACSFRGARVQVFLRRAVSIPRLGTRARWLCSPVAVTRRSHGWKASGSFSPPAMTSEIA